jgi:hypothetical protein
LDEAEKEKLLHQLGVFKYAGEVAVWTDDQIDAGEDWQQEIERVLSAADVAVLLITDNFLDSDFIRDRELPVLLKRHQERHLSIVPIIVRDCAWELTDWLKGINVKPKNGAPVWREGGIYVDQELKIIVKEIAGIIRKRISIPDSSAASATPITYLHILSVSTAPVVGFARIVGALPFLPRRMKTKSDQRLSELNGLVLTEIAKFNGQFKHFAGPSNPGNVLVATNDPSALMGFTLQLARVLNKLGIVSWRMGLHSEAVPANYNVEKATQPPRPGSDLARRIMCFGGEAHILASDQGRRFLATSEESQHLFHEVGNREVWPFYVVNLCSIYDEATGLGNKKHPSVEIPEEVVRKATFPRTMKPLRRERIAFVFDGHLSFVKIQFTITPEEDAQILRISRAKVAPEDRAFDFDFTNSAVKRAQPFEIVVTKALKEDSLAILDVRCYDHDDQLVATRTAQINLRRDDLGWLWDRARFSPLYLKALSAVVLLVLILLSLTLALGIDNTNNLLESLLIRSHVFRGYPDRLLEPTDAIADDIIVTTDNKPDPAFWRCPTGDWIITQGYEYDEDDPKPDGALQLRGEGLCLLNLPANKSFYDFTLHFEVGFQSAEKVSWAFRVQPDNQRVVGYVFDLTKGNKEFTLQPYLYTASGEHRPLGNALEISMPDCCLADDRLEVEATVNRYRFGYVFTLQGQKSNGHPRNDLGHPNTIEIPEANIVSQRPRYRYGNVALLGTNPSGEANLEYLAVKPIKNRFNF